MVSYSTFRATAPPSAGSFFGRSNDVGPAAYVNPADPSGGSGRHPFFLAAGARAASLADPARTGEITTPFVTYPDLVEAECISQDGYTWLSLTVNGDPADARTDDIEATCPVAGACT